MLAVMETLTSVAYREFRHIVDTQTVTDQSEHLVHLLCSLQASLMTWIHKMLSGEDDADVPVIERTLIDCKNVELCLAVLSCAVG